MSATDKILSAKFLGFPLKRFRGIILKGIKVNGPCHPLASVSKSRNKTDKLMMQSKGLFCGSNAIMTGLF